MADDAATLKDYLHQWNNCFNCEKSSNNFIHHLRDLAFHGKLRGCNFRSVCWRVFLNCIPPDPSLWKDVLKESRDKYETIKSRHICDPKMNDRKKDTSVENPLSQDDQSLWNKYFKDLELRKTIKRDVSRTFPEMRFFHNDDIHALLVDVLFCYACEHSDLSYRQGMHELLAPLVFVIHCDLEAASCAKERGQLTDLIEAVLDRNYLEHDVFQMFYRLMESTNEWYSVNAVEEISTVPNEENSPDDTENKLEKPFQEKQVPTTSTLAISNKLNHIYNTLLSQHDSELHAHLNYLEIIPQVFGLRWIRLLFGREFTLQDLLVLWDALFADGHALDLVDYLFVAMLIHIRRQLLGSDNTTCLQILMKYPAVDDINDIVQAAKSIRDGCGIPGLVRRTSAISSESTRVKPSKQNSFIKAFHEFRRKVIPEPRTSSNTHPQYSNTSRVPESKSLLLNPPTAQASGSEQSTSLPGVSSSLNEDEKVSHSNLEKMNSMCKYCSDKLEACIATLQAHVRNESLRCNNYELQSLMHCNNEQGDPGAMTDQQNKRESILLTLANLKQVRDILRGTINFDLNVVDDATSSGKT